MKKRILHIVSFILSAYFAYSSLVIVKIFTNDLLLNSYIAYEKTKLSSLSLLNTAETGLQKAKLFFQKYTNKKEYQQTKQELLEQQKISQELLKKQQEEFEKNRLILSLLPYVIALVLFVVFYVKIFEILSKFENIVKS
jgi:hypothetical protein